MKGIIHFSNLNVYHIDILSNIFSSCHLIENLNGKGLSRPTGSYEIPGPVLSGKPSNLQYSAFPCWLRRAGRFWPERKKRSRTVEYYSVSPSECSLEMCSPWMIQLGSDPGLCLLWPPWFSWWPHIHHQICREMITRNVSQNRNANKKKMIQLQKVCSWKFHVNKICDLTCIWGAGLCQDT